MKYTFLIYMLLYSQIGSSQPEWQYFKSNETVSIDGQVVKPNQLLLINHINNGATISTDNLDQLPFQLDDTSAISAMSIDFSNFNKLTVAFNTPVDGFLPGEVVSCYSSCVKIFSVVDDLGLDSHIHVDAINWEYNPLGTDYLLVSFSQDFIYNGNYFYRNHVYSILYPDNINPSLSAVPVMEADSLNIKENMNLVALDSVNFNASFLEFYAVDTVFTRENNVVVFPSEFFETTDHDISNVFSDELTSEAKGLSAMMTLDTGWVSWKDDGMNIEVMENTGFVDFILNRLGGKEHAIVFEVMSIDGTAINGIDYSKGPTTFDWVHLASQDQNFQLEILDNQIVGRDKQLTLKLVEDSDFALVDFGLSNQITITILDDDGDLIFKNGFN